MFKTSITSTPFTSEAANSFFQNITGSYFGNDCSFLSTLRALVAPRIKEDESVYLTFGSTNYDGTLSVTFQQNVRLVLSVAVIK